MAYKLDEDLKEAFLKHRRGEFDKRLDGTFALSNLSTLINYCFTKRNLRNIEA